MINTTAAVLLAIGLILHSLGETYTLLAAVGIVFAMAFFFLMYLQYPVLFVGAARYPLARKFFPPIRWAIFAIYLADLSTTLMRHFDGPVWEVSMHAYSIWAGIYLVAYSLAILTGPPKQRKRKRRLKQAKSRPRFGNFSPSPA